MVWATPACFSTSKLVGSNFDLELRGSIEYGQLLSIAMPVEIKSVMLHVAFCGAFILPEPHCSPDPSTLSSAAPVGVGRHFAKVVNSLSPISSNEEPRRGVTVREGGRAAGCRLIRQGERGSGHQQHPPFVPSFPPDGAKPNANAL